MSDVVVTVPKRFWSTWLAEGDLVDQPWTGCEWGFYFGNSRGRARIEPGERVYVVAHDRLRGYSPLTSISYGAYGWALVRRGGAVACTLDVPVPGFRGWRYRWWDRTEERPFPSWQEA